MGRGGPAPPEFDEGNLDLVKCRFCPKRFAPDRVAIHESSCPQINRKRRTFDAKKQRLRGTEAAGFQRSANQKQPVKHTDMIGGKPKYKVEHENLVAALRAARRMAAYEDARAVGKAKGPPPPMPVLQEVPDDRIQCRICGMKFGPEQYERHVSKGYCQPAGGRPTMPPRSYDRNLRSRTRR
jgi:hypothetical protein